MPATRLAEGALDSFLGGPVPSIGLPQFVQLLYAGRRIIGDSWLPVLNLGVTPKLPHVNMDFATFVYHFTGSAACPLVWFSELLKVCRAWSWNM